MSVYSNASIIERQKKNFALKSYSNQESQYGINEIPESRNSSKINYYSTSYSKFQKNAPGADMLNREYELKRR